MTNEYKLQVEENLISQKQELKESIKQIFKQLLVYLGIFMGIVIGFSIVAEVLRLLPLDFVTEELVRNIIRSKRLHFYQLLKGIVKH